MRPCSVYAKRSCPAGDPCDLLAQLRGPHRVGLRLVMILLSQQGWTATQIAELLGCDARMVRAGSSATTTTAPRGSPTGPGPAGRGWAARGWARGSAGCLPSPRRGRSRCSTPTWATPRSACGPSHRRVREVAAWRRPRLVAKGAPDADQVVAGVRQATTDLPDGAAVLAEDETHLNLLPWVRSTWVVKGTASRSRPQAATRGLRLFGAVDLRTGRWFYQVTRKAVSATFIGFMAHCSPATRTCPWWCWCLTTCSSTAARRCRPGCGRTHGCGWSTAPVTAPTTTPSNASGARSRPRWPTARALTIGGRVRQVHAFFRQRTNEQLLATAAPHSSPWLPPGYGQNTRQAA
jgi:hypothetical protein